LELFKKALRWPRGGEETVEDTLYVVGEKVLLRDKRTSDIPDDYAWRRDPKLSKLDATLPMQMSYDEYERYAHDELSYNSRWSKRFAIDTLEGGALGEGEGDEAEPGRHIGNCMYYDIDERRGETELGIMVGDRDYWGRGYGTDAVRTMLDYIFTATKLNKVYLHTLVWNDRARGSFAKSGFVEVREVRRNSMDFMRMEVQRQEWEAARQKPVTDAAIGADMAKGAESDAPEQREQQSL
jgi:RimJ/RimL family protein N-acetyltransferase